MKLTCIRHLTGIITLLWGVIAFGSLSSCDSAIYDDEGDCSVHYRVTFTYDMNMKWANAFPHEVKSVTLYIYDRNGQLVMSKTDNSAALASPDYYMDVEVLPGKYDLLVWATGKSPVDNPTAFEVASAAPGSTMSTLGAKMPLDGTPADGGYYVDRDIVPLYHGIMRGVDFPDTYGNVTLGPVSLTKDTNVMQVLLQNTDGTTMKADDFSFYITAANNELDYLNKVVSTTQFSYRPWAMTLTSASLDKPEAQAASSTPARALTEANGILAELSTGRLIDTRTQRLVVRRNSDGEDIININLIQYLLMVKGEYNRQMSNQEYLDRNDNYSLMFFVDDNRNWYIAAWSLHQRMAHRAPSGHRAIIDNVTQLKSTPKNFT